MNRRWKMPGLTTWILVGSLLVSPGVPIPVPARAEGSATAGAETPGQVVAAARQAYSDAEFEQAIDLLLPLLESSDVSPQDEVAVREILARSYFKQRDLVRSREAWRSLLEVDAAWRPGPEVPADEAQLFREVLSQMAPAQGRRAAHRKWWLIGAAGAAVAGLVVILASGGGGGGGTEPTINDPPPPPGGVR